MATAVFSGTREELADLMRRLPAILAGREADVGGIARGLQLRLGVALMSKIQQAFIVKARGGTGDDGIQWPALQRATIAQRRTTAGERRAAGAGGKRVRGLLTRSEDQRWRAIFAGERNRLMAKFGLDAGSASRMAAKKAWAILKSQGAKTKLGTFGGRKVDTLRDTGELFRSFSPGVEDRPSGAEGQVFDVTPGRVIVGTNKKPWHHRGIPGKLPARPFWPLDGSLPAEWWRYLLGVYVRGLARVLALLVSKRLP